MRRTSNLEKGEDEEKGRKTFSPHLLQLLQNSPAEQTPEHPKEKALKIDRSSANICRFSGRRTRADEQQPSLTFNYLMTLSIIQSMFTRICYNLFKLFNIFHRFLSQHAINSLPSLPLELGVDEGKRKYSDLVASLPRSLKTMNFHSRENKWETEKESTKEMAKWKRKFLRRSLFSLIPQCHALAPQFKEGKRSEQIELRIQRSWMLQQQESHREKEVDIHFMQSEN